ncbi:MAG: hypothetical protein H7840_06705 [Alphaproteobacteria bacterium]
MSPSALGGMGAAAAAGMSPAAAGGASTAAFGGMGASALAGMKFGASGAMPLISKGAALGAGLAPWMLALPLVLGSVYVLGGAGARLGQKRKSGARSADVTPPPPPPPMVRKKAAPAVRKAPAPAPAPVVAAAPKKSERAESRRQTPQTAAPPAKAVPSRTLVASRSTPAAVRSGPGQQVAPAPAGVMSFALTTLRKAANLVKGTVGRQVTVVPAAPVAPRRVSGLTTPKDDEWAVETPAAPVAPRRVSGFIAPKDEEWAAEMPATPVAPRRVSGLVAPQDVEWTTVTETPAAPVVPPPVVPPPVVPPPVVPPPVVPQEASGPIAGEDEREGEDWPAEMPGSALPAVPVDTGALSRFIDDRVGRALEEAASLRNRLAEGRREGTQDRRFSFRVAVPPGAMEIRWVDKEGTDHRSPAINISLHGILFEADDPYIMSIRQIACPRLQRTINVTKSIVHRREVNLSVAVLAGFEKGADDWMSWVEILTRIDQE